MVENLKRLREPAAWALLAVIVGFMALSITRLVLVLTRREAPVFSAFNDIASSAMPLTLVVLQVVLVCLCLFRPPMTPHAVTLTRWSGLVVSFGTVFTIVATGLGLASSDNVMGVVFEALGGLLDIVLKLLAMAALWVIYRAVSSGRMAVPVQSATVEPDLSRSEADEIGAVWKPSEAAGSVWRTAADAATGSAPTVGPADGRGIEAAPASQAAAEASGVPTPPVAREGAAEALGWRRVPSDTSSVPRAGDDTP